MLLLNGQGKQQKSTPVSCKVGKVRDLGNPVPIWLGRIPRSAQLHEQGCRGFWPVVQQHLQAMFPEWYGSDDQFPKLHLSAKLGKPSGSVCMCESISAKYAGRQLGVCTLKY